MVEGCRDGEEWIGIREVVGWSSFVISGDEHEYAWKGSGKWKAKEESAVFFEEDLKFLLLSYLQYITEWGFLKELDTEYRFWSFMEAHPAHNFRVYTRIVVVG